MLNTTEAVLHDAMTGKCDIIIQRYLLILLLWRSIAVISIGPQRHSLLRKVFTAFFKFRKTPVFFLCDPLSHSDTTL